MNKRKGFTLIEAVMVLSLTAILTVGIGNIIVSSIRAWIFVSGRDNAINSGRSAMNYMLSELRLMNTNASLNMMATSECSFTDINGNSIDYKQSGTNLMRNSDTLEVGLANPNGLVFTYVNAYGQAVLTKNQVRSVRVRLSLVNAPLNVTFESSARIRNL